MIDTLNIFKPSLHFSFIQDNLFKLKVGMLIYFKEIATIFSKSYLILTYNLIKTTWTYVLCGSLLFQRTA